MNDRITYAQKKLLALVEARQLRSWCLELNLPHASLYKLAVGQSVPTFKAISYLVPYFAPAEWLFFTDEEIPYPIRTLPEWNPDDTSVFIQKHKKKLEADCPEIRHCGRKRSEYFCEQTGKFYAHADEANGGGCEPGGVV